MSLPNNLRREYVSEIIDMEKDSPIREIEKARTASNSAGSSIERCLRIDEADPEQDLLAMCERFKLD